MMNLSKARHRSAGFTLLEIILALALFAMAAVGLMGALNEIGIATLEAEDSARLTRLLRSHLTEVTREGVVTPREFDTETDLAGVRLRTVIEEMSLRAESGADLQEMYRVKVSAYRGRQRDPIDHAETWVYRPLFTPL